MMNKHAARGGCLVESGPFTERTWQGYSFVGCSNGAGGTVVVQQCVLQAAAAGPAQVLAGADLNNVEHDEDEAG
jgi:hypothetical protein